MLRSRPIERSQRSRVDTYQSQKRKATIGGCLIAIIHLLWTLIFSTLFTQTDEDLKRYFLFNYILLSFAKSKFIEEVNSFRSNLDLEYFHLTEGDLVTITKTVNICFIEILLVHFKYIVIH